MMPTTKPDIASLFDPVLQEAGFKRQRSHWLRLGEDLVQQVSLTRNRWGAGHRIEWGLMIVRSDRSSIIPAKPQDFDAHWLMEAAEPEADKLWPVHQALDPKSAMSQKKRQATIRAFLADCVLPRLDRCRTVQSVVKAMDSDKAWYRPTGLDEARWSKLLA